MVIERRKKRSREEWGRLVVEQARCGLAAAEFCRREDVGVASFYQWRRRLGAFGERKEVSEPQSFIDMGRVAVAESSADGGRSLEVTLELVNRRVRQLPALLFRLGRAFALDDHQGDAVDEQHQVRVDVLVRLAKPDRAAVAARRG